MRMFGFKLSNVVQSLVVECPSCHRNAHLLFRPCEKDMPIPLYGVKEAEKIVADITTMPKAEDTHFHCLSCWKSVKLCEVFKRKCLINMEEVGKDLRREDAQTPKEPV